jgi:hypothetical protein
VTIVNELDLAELVLYHGAHDPNGKMCVMEAVAFVAGEPWSDHPECASPVIGAFLRSWNDVLDDEDRQQLKPYVTKLVGTKGTKAQEDARVWMALDWLVRDYTPVWLRLAGLNSQAELLVNLPEFKKGMKLPSVKPTLEAVRKDAAAARDAARAGAWDAARAGAWDAARAGAWDAARAGAWAAAWAAARAAAGDAAWAAAWAAAGDAAWAAAGDAAWAAARAAAGDAAGAAARAALQPAVTECQQSAHRLLDRMIAVTAGGEGDG